MISNKCPIVDEQVKAFFVIQKVAVTKGVAGLVH